MIANLGDGVEGEFIDGQNRGIMVYSKRVRGDKGKKERGVQP